MGPFRTIPAVSDEPARDVAMDLLFRRYYADLVRLAICLVGDRPQSEDIVQDVFVALYRHWNDLRDREAAVGPPISSRNHCRPSPCDRLSRPPTTAVSLQAYQRAQVADDPPPRRGPQGPGPWDADLAPRERERLVAQATDAGLALGRQLHKGWRLTKLLTLLPVTFRVGDTGLLSDLVGAFWRDHLPEGLYFEAEAGRFADFVAARVPGSSALHDAGRLEGALLAVGQRGASMRTTVELRVTRDPRQLLSGAPGGTDAPLADGPGYDVFMTAGPAVPGCRSAGPSRRHTSSPGNSHIGLFPAGTSRIW